MQVSGRKTIGVFVTQVNQEYHDALSRGICDYAKKLGYNVAFFSNYLGYGEYQYEQGERNIADLPDYRYFDGVIIAADVMDVQGFEERIKSNIKECGLSIPIVSVRQKIEDCYNVLINENSVLEDMICHFIEKHGIKKINLLTGSKDSPIAMERLEAYKKAIANYGIPYEEGRVYYADFYKSGGYQAIEQWMSDPDRMPEGIICANDFMAFTVCNALSELGISVPKDIAIMGYDSNLIAESYGPSISSVDMPIYDMGVEAVNKIDKHNSGVEQERNTYLKTLINFRESCGCNSVQKHMANIKNRIISEMESKDKQLSNNAFMSIELTGVKVIDELDQKLAAYVYMNEGFSSFYMCLNKDWDSFNTKSITDSWRESDLIMEVGIKNGQLQTKMEFERKYLLPPIHDNEGPQFFFYNMLHYQEKCFGYTAISFFEPQAYKLAYQGWLINVCNALENVRIHTELNRLVYKLEDMYIKDELTGLYNRRGLQLLGKKYLKQSLEQKSSLMLFTADLDRLKYINDNFGHGAGDVAIKAVADALMHAAEDDEICMRIGGDEFTVVGLEYDESKLEQFIQRFMDELDRFNREEGYIFKVYVSYGSNLVIPDETTTIEECLVIADEKMYKHKADNKNKRNPSVENTIVTRCLDREAIT